MSAPVAMDVFVQTLATSVKDVASVAIGAIPRRLLLEYEIPILKNPTQEYKIVLMAFPDHLNYPAESKIKVDYSTVAELKLHKDFCDIAANTMVNELKQLLAGSDNLCVVISPLPRHPFMKRLIIE